MAGFKRKRLFVDPHVQGALLARVLIYWLSCMIFGVLGLSLAQTLFEPNQYFFQRFDDILREHWPILVMLIAALPFILYDALKASHKFAGPIFRLRRDLQRHARGERIKPIHFRTGDHWQDLADQVNRLVERLEVAERNAMERDTTEVVAFAENEG